MQKAALIIMLAALAACSGKGTEDASSTAGLEAANAAYDRALIDGNAEALSRLYTDDFTIIDDEANLRGKQDQIRTMTEVIDLLEARSDDVRVEPLGPDAAMLTGRFTGRYRVDGKENTFTERYTSIWVREGGEWKVRHEHASVLPKPQETPAA